MRLMIVALTFAIGCAHNPAVRVEQVKTKPIASEVSEGWLLGTMTRIDDGAKFSFRIERKWTASATGRLEASKDDEIFHGRYAGKLLGSYASTWAEAQASGYTFWGSQNAVAEGILDNGSDTVIQIRLTIQSGWLPHGLGTGIDNKGRGYQISL